MSVDRDATYDGQERTERERRPSDRPTVAVKVEDDRTGMDPATLERAVLDHLYYTCGKDERSATLLDVYRSVALACRDRLVHRWVHTQRGYYEVDAKRVYYLSAEFLLGRLLAQNLISLGLYELARKLLPRYGVELGDLLELEPDPGLGTGGLGRLAACYLDSMATLGLPAHGYGIRYDYGIFEQRVRDGWQVEAADTWLRYGNPWEIARHEYTAPVHFYGRVEEGHDENGRFCARWVDTKNVLGVPYDTPIPGYGRETVNTLRLWSARATVEFDLHVFNEGDYRRAVEDKALTESISKVLYPKDQSPEGRELRLKQQYFFVACSIHDIMRRYKKNHDTMDALPDKAALQLNDTHPAIAIAELMRVLVDHENVPWDKAWEITKGCTAYTNHTLLPEALETWPVWMFAELLPRHLSIIYEINRRFLKQVHVRAPGDTDRQARMSIVTDDPEPHVRMAHLAVVGSHSVNGVAALHSKLVKSHLLPDFADLWPERFNNKTNGVTPRRWLLSANPTLSTAITERIGRGWITDLEQLSRLSAYVDDPELHHALEASKRENKSLLARLVEERNGVEVDLDTIFDTQAKRIHEYKRQLLMCLYVISCYRRLKEDPDADFVPRTFFFSGKAAPGYAMAKLHIKLINDVAELINADPVVRDKMRVVFLANYSVSVAERLVPATDLSEQISLAGMEASGTGNMKFMMNGALTIGTLDGANIEIREAAGEENFFCFGMTAEEVERLRSDGYDPRRYIDASPRLADALDAVELGVFSPEEPGRFRPLVDAIRFKDTFMVCADFDEYVRMQAEVERVYRDRTAWNRRVVHNLARAGRFSSDRSIAEYARDIWDVEPVDVRVPQGRKE